jgi:L-cysteine S-thiosulfotransferase
MKVSRFLIAGSAATLVLAMAGCNTMPDSAKLDQMTHDIVQASFRDQGEVKTDRLEQDEANRACSQAAVSGQALDDKQTQAIEAAQMATVQWPAGGQYLGDWQEGEKIAQSGVGLTWTDNSKNPNGGNCYNCHQITKEEISFGTLGPSLYNYGKIRGVKDPSAPDTAAIVQYTWGKIWNARAYNACSNMPRFGSHGILNETQIRHVMALLLDPRSPVNQ